MRKKNIAFLILGVFFLSVTLAIFFTIKKNVEQFSFDEIYQMLQKPLIAKPISSKEPKKYSQSTEGYFFDQIAKRNGGLQVEEQFKGDSEYTFESVISDLMGVKIFKDYQNRVSAIAFYYNFKDTLPDDEERESIPGRYYAIAHDFGKPIVEKFKDKTKSLEGYCIFDGKTKYILFGSYGETDLVIADISKKIIREK